MLACARQQHQSAAARDDADDERPITSEAHINLEHLNIFSQTSTKLWPPSVPSLLKPHQLAFQKYDPTERHKRSLLVPQENKKAMPNRRAHRISAFPLTTTHCMLILECVLSVPVAAKTKARCKHVNTTPPRNFVAVSHHQATILPSTDRAKYCCCFRNSG